MTDCHYHDSPKRYVTTTIPKVGYITLYLFTSADLHPTLESVDLIL